MKNLTFTLFFLLLTTTLLNAQLPANCNAPAPRVIMAGDSWAQYMADDDTHNEVLKMYGHSDKTSISSTFEVGILCGNDMPGAGDPFYTVSGSLARQWADETNFNYLQNLINAINAAPEVDVVMLSIGGNDILAGRSENGWYFDMDLDVAGSEAALFSQITADMMHVMNRVWAATRSDMKFVISSYDFPNFNVEGGIFLGPSYGSFYAFPKRIDLSRDEDGDDDITGSEHLITDAELNNMMSLVEQIRKDIADNDPRIFYDNGQGLMQYYYGYDDSPYPAIAPGTTPHPQGVSPYAGGGNSAVPVDRDNFRTVSVCGLGWFPADPIHLDEEGYQYKIKNQFDNIFFENYRGAPDATFFSESANDGYVDVIGQTVEANGIRVGDDGPFCCSGGANNDYRGIFSFNTASLPDNASITGASLYMMRSGVNDNPFNDSNKSPVLDIKSGHFGATPGLEWTDGTDAADATDIGCFHGTAQEDKYAIRVDLNGGLDFINPTGTTQIRMSFTNPDWSVEYINFYDGGGAAALLPPEVEALQNPPVYEYRTVKRSYGADGTETDEVMERGPEITRREGYVYHEKIKSAIENEEGDQILSMVMMPALEHAGLSKYMSDTQAAPGGGFAPFLDITYELLLPAELAFFTAKAQEKNVLLSWQTISEQNTDYFAIEHSSDGRMWTNIGESAAAKNSSQAIDYQHVHNNPIVGKNYYRLQTLDLDGKAEYSEIRTVNFKRGAQDLTIYPNPFTDEFVVSAVFNQAGNARLEISDIFGRTVASRGLNVSQGTQEITVNDLSNFAVGTYVLKIYLGSEVFFGKVVKR